jgi:hypothetical protein
MGVMWSPRTGSMEGKSIMTTTFIAPAASYTDAIGAALILGIAPKTLRNWASLKTGPPVFRFGGSARYGIAEIHEWASAQRVTA